MTTLRQRATGLLTGATGVLILTTLGMAVIRMISSVTLTRILSPEVFGLVGIISSIDFTIQMLTDLGFQAYMIRHPRGDDPHVQSVVWSIHTTRGIGLSLISMLVSPVVAWALAKPELLWPLFVASVLFAIDGSASMAVFTTIRANRSRKVSLMDLAFAAVQVVICVPLALWLRNVWAIIVTMIAMSCIRSAASHLAYAQERVRFKFDRAIAGDFWRFARLIMVSSFLTLLISQTDKLVLARVLPLAQVGLYTTALTLASFPQSLASAYATRILYPAYAEALRHDAVDRGATYYGFMRKTAPLYALGCGAAIGGAQLVVTILYDPRYLQAGLYTAILLLNTLFLFPTKAMENFLVAAGRIHFTYRSNIARLLWLAVVAPVLFAGFGSLGLIIAFGTIELSAYAFGLVNLYRLKMLNPWRELTYAALAAGGAVAAYAIAQVMMAWLPIR